MGSITGLSNPSVETINRGPMTIFQGKLLTRTYCDEAGDYAAPNLSPRNLVFRPDLRTKTVTFMGRINYRLWGSKSSFSIYLGYFSIYEDLKF